MPVAKWGWHRLPWLAPVRVVVILVHPAGLIAPQGDVEGGRHALHAGAHALGHLPHRPKVRHPAGAGVQPARQAAEPPCSFSRAVRIWQAIGATASHRDLCRPASLPTCRCAGPLCSSSSRGSRPRGPWARRTTWWVLGATSGETVWVWCAWVMWLGPPSTGGSLLLQACCAL